MPVVIQAEARKTRDLMYFIPGDMDLKIGEECIAETENGQEVVKVVSAEKVIDKPKGHLYGIIRKITPEDVQEVKDNQMKARELYYKVLNKVKERELALKLTSVDYNFDRSKLFIYYTAEGRIDFRELVKDLGYLFKTRIQMVQIGVRDETKLIGGYGHCGRELCCCSFIKEFNPVSIDMAKEQELSLNPAKISGVCGRLLCCLAYENDFYKISREKLPRKGSKVTTKKGTGTITEVNYLDGTLTVKYDSGETEKLAAADVSTGFLSKLGLKWDKKGK